MYLKEIEIKNYGCINNLFVEAQFDENGNPYPIVLIGENGAGKTLVIANVVDALVEIKRQTYAENIQEVSNNMYFQVGNLNYIKNGETYSKVRIAFQHDTKVLQYYNVMSKTPVDDCNKKELKSCLIDFNNFRETGFERKNIGALKRQDYHNFILIYFPSDRYYVPLWYNANNYQKITYKSTSDVYSSKTNIIKTDILSNIKDWIIDVFLEKTTQQLQLPKGVQMAGVVGNVINVLIPTPMQILISDIFSIIKGKGSGVNFNTNRKNKVVGISSVNDISQLSEGEMCLFALAISIIKEWDLEHVASDPTKVEGVVIIDEADLGLHIDFAYRALPNLMKFFPKIQFILTAHSPFLLAGLKKQYGDNIDILNMPKGIKVDQIETFSEMQKAFELFDEEAAELNERIQLLEKERERVKGLTDKIFIVTEGKTDIKHIKNAFSKLYSEDDEIISKIEYFDFAQKETLGDQLLDCAKQWALLPNASKIIAILDRDKHLQQNDKGKTYKSLGNNVFIFNIPPLINDERKEEDKISIEYYYTNQEIKSETGTGRLYLPTDFDKYGTSIDGGWSINNYSKGGLDSVIIDRNMKRLEQKSDGAKIATKDEFAEFVIANPEKFNLNNFKKIYNVISQIVGDCKESK